MDSLLDSQKPIFIRPKREIEGKVDTPVIVECFDQFSQQIKKRTDVFRDNSPLHRSQEFIRHLPQWVSRG